MKKNLTLITKVIGKPEPMMTWYVNNVEIKPTFKIKMTKEMEVANLTITGVTMNMTGDYKVVATNSVGTTEHTAKITVCGKWLTLCQSLLIHSYHRFYRNIFTS